jgi:hypothetical protein
MYWGVQAGEKMPDLNNNLLIARTKKTNKQKNSQQATIS